MSFFTVDENSDVLVLVNANLLLGRLIAGFFPRIFDKAEKEALDEERVGRLLKRLLRGLIRSILAKLQEVDGQGDVKERVANVTMARPIRALTEAREYATRLNKHRLASFGRAEVHLKSLARTVTDVTSPLQSRNFLPVLQVRVGPTIAATPDTY
ncbi:hypothetical protein K435DRAFT_811055 [Dendrothele bispora CBS 962.96]|uniref:Uncharacterized protein n=1 Tax=Dendrothele bispora (strain CBS 962.96) TaxID=1314807 RepID=A0A4V4HBE4_DENBC|nr:hypothetical protein K435DRAFT_811055 [Dendrothele bispora CBS 962.96]